MVTFLRRLPLVIPLVFASLLPVGSASAQTAAAEGSASGDGEARALFEAGREAFDAARFEAAIDYFQQAFELSGRPQFHFNIASAADRARQDALALSEYELYLAEVPDADNRSYVEGRITTLRANADGGPAVTDPDPAAPADGGGGDVTGEWWFWTLIGVLVVGAAVGITAGVLVGTAQPEAPYQGSFGPGVVVTLVEGEF